MDKRLILFASILVIILSAVYFFSRQPQRQNEASITSFEECVAAGYPVMESYPAQCRAGNQTFVQDIGNELEKMDVIRLDHPRPNLIVTSPFEVRGEARGTWYFEAEFPFFLYDDSGKEIAMGIARAEGEWMTEEFVPFSATLTFEQPQTESGLLVLRKSNPSGLPEHEDEMSIPVHFSASDGE